jgi:putative PIN family toxin of toxin-antitoxin system
MAWEAGRFVVVASQEMLREYQLVLDYPDVASRIYPELLRTFKSHLAHDIELVEPAETPRICRDPDDDKVIAAAIYGFVDYLVTIDQDLLADEIVTPLQELGVSVLSGEDLITLLDQSP